MHSVSTGCSLWWLCFNLGHWADLVTQGLLLAFIILGTLSATASSDTLPAPFWLLLLGLQPPVLALTAPLPKLHVTVLGRQQAHGITMALCKLSWDLNHQQRPHERDTS